MLTADECLGAAWSLCAPGRTKGLFPRGFWPDVARVAIEMHIQQSLTPTLSFRPTMCGRGDAPEIKRPSKLLKKSGVDLSSLNFKI
jgi:hypothetical protein